jgi:hypothetical protein
METKNQNRIWKQTQRLYGVLILAYINLLDEMTEAKGIWAKHTQKCFTGTAERLAGSVYMIINDTQILPDWEYLGVDKPMLRHMEKEWLTAKDYHHRIGAYPTN